MNKEERAWSRMNAYAQLVRDAVNVPERVNVPTQDFALGWKRAAEDRQRLHETELKLQALRAAIAELGKRWDHTAVNRQIEEILDD